MTAAARRAMAVDDPRHGTLNGYSNLQCRCDACKAANSARIPEVHARRAGGLTPGDRRHGTDNGYTNYGCRCGLCRRARSELRKATRVKSVGGGAAR